MINDQSEFHSQPTTLTNANHATSKRGPRKRHANMKVIALLLLNLSAFLECHYCLALTPSFQQQQPAQTTTIKNTPRRVFFQTAIAATAAATLAPSVAQAANEASFVGTFSDPINHPGGTRTIRLLDDKQVGDYQLAEIQGGGGVGEPKNYVLPAIVIGNRTIIIDFSPKGGPKDFTGVLDKDGNIKFPRDGNKWPRLK